MLVPLSSVAALLRRIDPPWGTLSPTAYGSGSPFWFSNGVRLFEKALASGPAGAKRSGRGWRIACDSTPEPATAQGAECLLRSTPRGLVRTKAICARHAEGVASGHSFSDLGAVMTTWICHTGAQIAFLAIGGTGTSPVPVECAVGRIWGLSGDVCADPVRIHGNDPSRHGGLILFCSMLYHTIITYYG